MKANYSAFRALAAGLLLAATGRGQVVTTVPLGEISEQPAYKLTAPIPGNIERLLTVDEFRGSCRCITQIGLEKGRVLESGSGAPFGATIDLSGRRGPFVLQIAAKCHAADGKTSFVVWNLTGDVKPRATIRAFYNSGTFPIGSEKATDIDFQTATDEKVWIDQAGGSLGSRSTLTGEKKAYRLSIKFDTVKTGLFSGDLVIHVGELAKRVVFVWQVEAGDMGISEVVINPIAVGVWRPVELPVKFTPTERMVGVSANDKEDIHFRLAEGAKESGSNQLECRGEIAGPKKGTVSLEIADGGARRNVSLPFSAYFLASETQHQTSNENK